MSTPPLQLDPPIIGESRDTVELRRLVMRVADTDATVLVTGESGCGKELVARNLHSLSRRRRGPFVAVNCAALNPGVLESELFGHGKGSFTGAVHSHAGLFEQAEAGTLLLDEIGEIAPFIQAKLLRVLQDREVRRMGGTSTRNIDVRIVAATNANLDEKVRSGAFRTDLFYRLNVVEILVSPLRKHTTDILDLVHHFFRRRRRPFPEVPEATQELFVRYAWPGNVRELENELERLLALHPDIREITPCMLSDRLRQTDRAAALDVNLFYDTPLPKAVGYLEENLLRKTLEKTNWNKSQSARELGLSRQGLLKKIKRYGITRENENG